MTCMFKELHYCWLMYLKTFEICLEKYGLDLAYFLSVQGIAWKAASKRPKSN